MAATARKKRARLTIEDMAIEDSKSRSVKKQRGEENADDSEDKRFAALKNDDRFSCLKNDERFSCLKDDDDDTQQGENDDVDYDEDEEGDGDNEKEEEKNDNDNTIKKMTVEKTSDHKEKTTEGKNLTPGIIYLSKIPPFMKPKQIRMIFSQFGEVGRLFLQPETKFKRKERKKRGGNSSKSFEEGWVEFKDKKVAKRVAWSLNNTPIGGKKHSRYHYDIWNIKYLHRFKWTHLNEKLAYERAVHEQRMRNEISQARKETSFYLQSVQKKKMVDEMLERKRKKGKEVKSVEKKYKQRATQEELNTKPSEKKKEKAIKTDLLSKIFKGGS